MGGWVPLESRGWDKTLCANSLFGEMIPRMGGENWEILVHSALITSLTTWGSTPLAKFEEPENGLQNGLLKRCTSFCPPLAKGCPTGCNHLALPGNAHFEYFEVLVPGQKARNMWCSWGGHHHIKPAQSQMHQKWLEMKVDWGYERVPKRWLALCRICFHSTKHCPFASPAWWMAWAAERVLPSPTAVEEHWMKTSEKEKQYFRMTFSKQLQQISWRMQVLLYHWFCFVLTAKYFYEKVHDLIRTCYLIVKKSPKSKGSPHAFP